MKIARKISAMMLSLTLMTVAITGFSFTSDSVTPRADASTSCWASPNKWSVCEDRTKAQWGWNASTQMTYTWNVPIWSYKQAFVQVRGFDSRHREIWRNGGAGTGGRARVPWGNVIAYKKIKARSAAVPFGTTIILN